MPTFKCKTLTKNQLSINETSAAELAVVGSNTNKGHRFMKREPTRFHMDTSLKDAMRKIADYRHATLSNVIEQGARLLVSTKSVKI